MISSEKMILLSQGQLDAYNKGFIANFVRFYHPEIEAYRLPEMTLICKGMAEFTKVYEKRFEDNPRLHCELRSRTVLSQSVLDEEWVTGVENDPSPGHLVAIYHFKENLI